jgi:small subunit ribosomal protein S16
MVRIRLRRMGKKGQPSYRVVVADSESPRDGRFIEIIGSYNPRTDPPTIEIEQERARYWLSVGAQPSDPVVRLLRKVGVLSGGEAEEAVVEPVEEEAPEAEVEAQVEVALEEESGDDADAESAPAAEAE